MYQQQHPNGQQFLNKIENTREHVYTKIHKDTPHTPAVAPA
uniref:AT25108p n=1 Tax=Drosophila melanogaster TaxID=7227 RepID=Q8T962_DROME|nr:AT25108p [Drosophila melanogaster]